MSAHLIGALLLAIAAGSSDDGRDRGAGSAKRLELRGSPYGQVLFDGRRRALYAFSEDGPGPRCYGRCAEVWPPFRSRGHLMAGAGVKKRLIGTAERRGGAQQVTYRGQPLYRYKHDPRGKVFCHEVFEFGGEWLALRRSGRPAP